MIGDLPIAAISRDDALSYRNWWMERMIPREEGEKPAKPNTANRHIGNMRTLHEAYFSHKGDEERLNPFRKMFFKGESRVDRSRMTGFAAKFSRPASLMICDGSYGASFMC